MYFLCYLTFSDETLYLDVPMALRQKIQEHWGWVVLACGAANLFICYAILNSFVLIYLELQGEFISSASAVGMSLVASCTCEYGLAPNEYTKPGKTTKSATISLSL